MEAHPYHHYLFFRITPDFYGLPDAERKIIAREFADIVAAPGDGSLCFTYETLGFKPDTAFMLWYQSGDVAGVQIFLKRIFGAKFGKYAALSYTYFGMVRPSQYSGRTGKPDQTIQNFTDRLPYLVVYPFTKTAEWYALDFEARKTMMGEHIKIGVSHPSIRQCLLYSFGVDDHEFVVSYEMKSLEEFQDLVMELRKTAGRKYTASDTPTFTCIYRSPEELAISFS